VVAFGRKGVCELGQVHLPHRPRPAVFARSDEHELVVWRDRPHGAAGEFFFFSFFSPSLSLSLSLSLPHAHTQERKKGKNNTAIKKKYPAEHQLHPLADKQKYKKKKQLREDAEGIQQSINYIHSLIDDEIARGTPSERIILGGFSQGGCIALAAALSYKVICSTWFPQFFIFVFLFLTTGGAGRLHGVQHVVSARYWGHALIFLFFIFHYRRSWEAAWRAARGFRAVLWTRLLPPTPSSP